MPKPKGGRGKIAPYVTRQVRVPEPIITQVDMLIEQYQDYIASGGSVEKPPMFVVGSIESTHSSTQLSEAVVILQEALKLKPNAGGAIKNVIRRALEILNI